MRFVPVAVAAGVAVALFTAIILVLALSIGSGGGSGAGAPEVTGSAGSGQLEVSDAWVRVPMAGRDITAGYLRITNGTDLDDRLIAATSADAQVVELHTHIHEDGVMRMRRVEGFDLPARGEIVLAPRGDHLMLIGLTQEIAVGGVVIVTLEFEKAGEIRVAMPVRERAEEHHGHH
jgi:copper(I)-binding protein